MNSTSLNTGVYASSSQSVMPAKCFSCKWNDMEEWDDQHTACPFHAFLQDQEDTDCMYYEPIA